MNWPEIFELFKKAYFALDDIDDVFYAAGLKKPFWIWYPQRRIKLHLLRMRDVYCPDEVEYHTEFREE